MRRQKTQILQGGTKEGDSIPSNGKVSNLLMSDWNPEKRRRSPEFKSFKNSRNFSRGGFQLIRLQLLIIPSYVETK